LSQKGVDELVESTNSAFRLGRAVSKGNALIPRHKNPLTIWLTMDAPLSSWDAPFGSLSQKLVERLVVFRGAARRLSRGGIVTSCHKSPQKTWLILEALSNG
jgi:hypothetical protein